MEKCAMSHQDNDWNNTIKQLATLPCHEYDMVRKERAKALRTRVSTLDEAVQAARDAHAMVSETAKNTLVIWDEPVEGKALLDEIATMFCDYIHIDVNGAQVLALWAVFTHAINLGDTNPRLVLYAPEKRCGKTTAMRLLNMVAHKPHYTSNITPAALFRLIARDEPTLLIDEAGEYLKNDQTFTSLLNSGLNRDTAFVDRTNLTTYEPERFSTWAPIAIALIGRLWGTLEDRSIMIPMKRKLPSDDVKRLTQSTDYRYLASKAARWVQDNAEQIKSSDPAMPSTLHDRQQDIWRPLLAIADMAGEGWAYQARQAAEALSRLQQEEDSLRLELLTDIRDLFREISDDRIRSMELLDGLNLLQDRPWSTHNRGRQMGGYQLARLLRPYGIQPRTIRIGTGTAKGYKLEDFEDAFARYLPQEADVTV
jgi:putative DNA primase/helicase